MGLRLTGGFHQTRVTKKRTSCSFFIYHLFLLFFPPRKIDILLKRSTVNDCERMPRMQRKGKDLRTTASNKKQNFLTFKKIQKFQQKKTITYFCIWTAETWCSRRFSHYIDVVYVTQSLTRRCSRSFSWSSSKVVKESFTQRQQHTVFKTQCFEQINVAFVWTNETNDILAVTFSYY